MQISLWITLGLVIIFILSLVAAYYVIKLHRFNKAQKLKLLEQEKVIRENHARIGNSIWVIAKSLLDDQVSISEGAIRISVLIEGLDLSEDERSHYVSFQKMAQAISHIPILEEWKKLPSQQKKVYEKQMEEEEEKYRAFILDAAKTLAQKSPATA